MLYEQKSDISLVQGPSSLQCRMGYLRVNCMVVCHCPGKQSTCNTCAMTTHPFENPIFLQNYINFVSCNVGNICCIKKSITMTNTDLSQLKYKMVCHCPGKQSACNTCAMTTHPSENSIFLQNYINFVRCNVGNICCIKKSITMTNTDPGQLKNKVVCHCPGKKVQIM